MRHALAEVGNGKPVAQMTSDPHVYERVLRTRLALLRARPDLSQVVSTLMGETSSTIDPLLAHDLERAGIVRFEGGTTTFACPLMERYLRSTL